MHMHMHMHIHMHTPHAPLCPCCRQNRSSLEYVQLVTAFKTYGDLHSGWQPQATVAQHLCIGSDDLEVPPLISSQARCSSFAPSSCFLSPPPPHSCLPLQAQR